MDIKEGVTLRGLIFMEFKAHFKTEYEIPNSIHVWVAPIANLNILELIVFVYIFTLVSILSI